VREHGAAGEAAKGGLDEVLQTLRMEDSLQDFFGQPGSIQLKTHLTQFQVFVMAKAMRFAKDWEIPELEAFVLDVMLNSVSLDRLSRREFTRVQAARTAALKWRGMREAAEDGDGP
jgi:hypothetical protein